MSTLNITLIDVAWGDSIFIESIDNSGKSFYALVDSNDTAANKSSYTFIKKFFERAKVDTDNVKHIFDFVLLSHAHSDHGQGLKEIMMKLGTKYFCYPKSNQWGGLSGLISFANTSAQVLHHESINSTKILPDLGDASLKVLWPDYSNPPDTNENNNSIVLSIQLNNVVVLLTGDAEKDVWAKIISRIPAGLRVFKVPHHGSVNGTFDDQNNPCWLNSIEQRTLLAISSHIKPYGHPHQQVICSSPAKNLQCAFYGKYSVLRSPHDLAGDSFTLQIAKL
jgi:competence protein ComEC